MRLPAVARSALSSLLGALAPPACAACDAPCRATDIFCDDCAEPLSSPNARDVLGVPVKAAGEHREPLSGAIARFKYRRRPDLARPLSRLMTPLLSGHDVTLVPVPLHPKRLAWRGFNQSALLARGVGKALGLSVLPLALRRWRDTTRQVGQGFDARQANVAGAFGVRNATAVAGKRIALVDDVLTTGATAAECVRVLRDSGADPAMIVTLAQVGA